MRHTSPPAGAAPEKAKRGARLSFLPGETFILHLVPQLYNSGNHAGNLDLLRLRPGMDSEETQCESRLSSPVSGSEATNLPPCADGGHMESLNFHPPLAVVRSLSNLFSEGLSLSQGFHHLPAVTRPPPYGVSEAMWGAVTLPLPARGVSVGP